MIKLDEDYALKASAYSAPGSNCKMLVHTSCPVGKTRPHHGFVWVIGDGRDASYTKLAAECYTCRAMTPEEIFQKAHFLCLGLHDQT